MIVYNKCQRKPKTNKLNMNKKSKAIFCISYALNRVKLGNASIAQSIDPIRQGISADKLNFSPCCDDRFAGVRSSDI